MTYRSPSQILSLEDELTAFEFDAACNYALLEYENHRDFKRLESLIKSLAVMGVSMLGGDTSALLPSESDDIIDDAEYQASHSPKSGIGELSV